MNNLVWFRNDLRTQDNNSLYKATKNAGKTVAVYCLDPRQFEVNKHGFKKTEKFWAKELKQDWRIAAKYFESMLIDFDVHSNYGKYQSLWLNSDLY